jgi:hypothetical protein
VRAGALAAGVAAALVLASSGAAVPPQPWKMMPYYDAVNSELWLVSYPQGQGETKCAWTGTYVLNSNTNDFPLHGCARPSYLWAKTCTAAPQNVKISKRIYVPGRPLVFEASLVSLDNRPLKVMELLVNGSPALVATHSVHKVNLKGRTNVFKLGWNTLEIVAKKGPSKKCSGDENHYGVLAEIHAAFRSDIQVTAPEPSPTTSAILIQEFTIKNAGPSTFFFGTVSYNVGTTHLVEIPGVGTVIISKGPLGPPLEDCTYYRQSTYCPIDQFDPGESLTLYGRFIYAAPPAPTKFFEEFDTSWGASADTIDSKPADNGGHRLRGTCRQDAPPPCKKPS